MENNGDNIFRQKLNSIEPEFDAHAWQQMEALLERKKKRRGFIWWWFSGAAAGLLLLVGIAAFWPQQNQSTFESERTTSNQHTSVANQGDKYKTVKQKTNNTATLIQTEKSNAASPKPNTRTEQKNTALSISNIEQSQSTKATTAASKKNGVASAVYSTLKQEENRTTETTIPAPRLLTANAELLYASLLKSSTEEFTALTASDEDVIVPRKKKPIVQYSAGVSGGVSFSTMQQVSRNSDFRQQAFAHKTPSWAVGFTNDILFVNRMSLSMGISYAQTSFTISPLLNNYPTGITSYRSDIRELNIPIGVKVYPYRTQKVGVYVNTGFVNHIKLSETFRYQTVQTSLTSGVQDFTSGLPTSNNFTSSGIESSSNNTNLVNAGVDRFSIARGNRYYASYYVHAGVEAIIRNRFIWFAEPSFMLSLATAQDMRKYNVGFVSGFRLVLP